MGSMVTIISVVIFALSLAHSTAGTQPHTALPSIIGLWTRPASSNATGHKSDEGLSLREDGTFGLVGISSMNGLRWHQDRKMLTLTTNTERYQKPAASTFTIQKLDGETLVITSKRVHHLNGTYHRAPYWRVSGAVAYRQRVALTPDAVVAVSIEDVSLQDAPVRVIAKKMLTHPGQVPIAFALECDPSKIMPGHSYAIQARILEEGRLRFLNAQRYSVSPEEQPRGVEIVLQPVE